MDTSIVSGKNIWGGPSSGFTLIELMMVMVIVAITLSQALPAVRPLLDSTQVRSHSSRLARAISLARSEAIARNTPVSLCPSAIASTQIAVCAGAYTSGWMVFSNRDRDRVVDDSTDQVIAIFESLPTGFTLTNRAGTRPATELITYLPDGSSRRTRTLMVCAPASSTVAGWSIIMNRVGRPRMSNDWGHCPVL